MNYNQLANDVTNVITEYGQNLVYIQRETNKTFQIKGVFGKDTEASMTDSSATNNGATNVVGRTRTIYIPKQTKFRPTVGDTITDKLTKITAFTNDDVNIAKYSILEVDTYRPAGVDVGFKLTILG